jgi:hypothetical protein
MNEWMGRPDGSTRNGSNKQEGPGNHTRGGGRKRASQGRVRVTSVQKLEWRGMHKSGLV